MQEKQSAELRAQMRDALAAAAEAEATAAAEAAGARAKWAGEAAQLQADCDSQCRELEEVTAKHRKELEVYPRNDKPAQKYGCIFEVETAALY